MNRITTIFFVFISSLAFSQTPPIDSETGKFSYKEVIKIDGATKDQLYNRAKVWIANHYPEASKAIQLDDKEQGKVIVMGNFPISLMGNKQSIENLLTLEVKEGRYKYTFTNFYISGPSVDHWALERNDLMMKKQIYKQVDEKVLGFIESINNAMGNEEKKEDW